jgi:DNA polymerase-4
LDFRKSEHLLKNRRLTDIGRAIKRDIRLALGEYVTVNIGIAPNRFYAKVAAGMDKPDGMDTIAASDILNVLGQLELIDLPGINVRYQARLNVAQIFSPLDFFEAPVRKLKKEVFKSIVGYYWHLRLHGYEIDAEKFKTKSFGNDYSVGEKTSDPAQVARLLMKLCEKTGRRLRKHSYQAQGVSLGLGFENGGWWGKSRRTKAYIYSTQDIYLHAIRLMNEIEFPARVTHINISVFNLLPVLPMQLGLFDGTRLDTRSLAQASDVINNRYGEFTMVPASMANMQSTIIKRVPFGSVRDL